MPVRKSISKTHSTTQRTGPGCSRLRSRSGTAGMRAIYKPLPYHLAKSDALLPTALNHSASLSLKKTFQHFVKLIYTVLFINTRCQLLSITLSVNFKQQTPQLKFLSVTLAQKTIL